MMQTIKIGSPTRSNRLTQGFGENNACAILDAQGKPVLPYSLVNQVNGACPVGTKSLYNLLGVPGHAGYDFGGYRNEQIHFDIETVGQSIDWEAIPIESPEGGIGVLIRSIQPVKLPKVPEMKGAQFKMVEEEYKRWGGAVHLMRYFGHMTHHNLTKERQRIRTGDVVGFMGDTGAVTGVHTHRYLAICGAASEAPFFIKDGDSEYKGRINEDEWMVNKFILDVMNESDDQAKIIELLKRKRDLLQIVASLYRRLIDSKKTYV